MSDQRNIEINVVELDASIQKLASNFDCDNAVINNFLRDSIALDIGFGKTYVWVDDESGIIGYYNIATGGVNDNASYKMGSAVHINEFALDKQYHGIKAGLNNMSDILLYDCLQRIKDLRAFIGFTFVTLYSTDRGESLYKRNDFYPLEEDMNVAMIQGKEDDGCIPMYLPLDIE